MRLKLVSLLAAGLLLAAFTDMSASPWGQQDPEALLQEIAATKRAAIGSAGLSVAASMPDGTVITAVEGHADAAAGTPLQPDGVMLAGSTGKILFATTALMLAERGALDLDAPISNWFGDRDWFPRLPNGPETSVRMLLNHTSGLVHHFETEAYKADFVAGMQADPDFTRPPEDAVLYVLDREPDAPAGAAIHYSDTNYILLALIMEQITGESAYRLIQKNILMPLGLENEIFPQTGRDIPRLVTGHWQPGQNYLGLDGTSNRSADGTLRYNPAIEYGGGGWAGTPRGFARLARWLYAEGLLSPAMQEAMMTPTPWIESGEFKLEYGLGVIHFTSPLGTYGIGHSGIFPGYRTEVYYYPEQDISIALMVNSELPQTNMFMAGADIAAQFFARLAD